MNASERTRQEFTLTAEELQALQSAQHQEEANVLWQSVADARGLDYMTITPVESDTGLTFSAVPKVTKQQDQVDKAPDPQGELVDNAVDSQGAPGSTAVVEFTATAAGLAELRQRLANLVFDVTTTKGMQEARKARHELVTLRTDLEELRLEKKRPLLERGKQLDAEAKRITAEIVALEDPIDRQIKAQEALKEQERIASEQRERERVAKIRAAIAELAAVPVASIGMPSAMLQKQAEWLESVELTTYAEFSAEALSVAQTAAAQIRQALARKLEEEAETARIAQQRQELEAERQAQEQRVAEETARLEAQRQEQARQDAAAALQRAQEQEKHDRELERQRQENEARIRSENEAAEAERERQRKADAEERAAWQSERDAENLRIAERNRLAREEEERQQQAAAELERQQREATEAEQRRKDEEALEEQERQLAAQAEERRLEEQRAAAEARREALEEHGLDTPIEALQQIVLEARGQESPEFKVYAIELIASGTLHKMREVVASLA